MRLFNDSNYYLLASGGKSQDIRKYRVERMTKVARTGSPRDGAAAFDNINISEYGQQVFGMMGGEKRRVQIRFEGKLLDTAVERFGKGKDTFYFQEDDDHFTVTTNVEISEQVFAWLCGFDEKVKLIGHEDTIADFKRCLDTIRGMY